MKKKSSVGDCPYFVGQEVIFDPPPQAIGRMPFIESRGIKIGEKKVIDKIEEGYLYHADGTGDFHWSLYRLPNISSKKS